MESCSHQQRLDKKKMVFQQKIEGKLRQLPSCSQENEGKRVDPPGTEDWREATAVALLQKPAEIEQLLASAAAVSCLPGAGGEALASILAMSGMIPA